MPFDLEKAIATWRRTLEHRRGFPKEDLDELECHVRDFIEDRVARGWNAEAAFRGAIERFGVQEEVEAEYRKIYWQKLRHQRRLFAQIRNETDMLKNFAKLAYRSLMRRKGYAFINVFGLALGLAACLTIGLFVQYKLSYDRFLPTSDRVYRVVLSGIESPDGTAQPDVAKLQPGVAAAARKEIPEIEALTNVVRQNKSLLRVDDHRFFVDRLFATDPAFFEVFPYRMIYGDVATALSRPQSLVLTQHEARRLFGDVNPVGEVVNYENKVDYEVSGVVEDPPANTHFPFDALRSFTEGERNGYVEQINWSPFAPFVYLLLPEGADPGAVAARFNDFKDRNAPDWFQKTNLHYALEALPRIHLFSNVGNDLGPRSDVRYLYLFSAIGALIFIIAAFNYMNLATARAGRRGVEIGVRKVVGAGRGQLVRQFLGESIVMTALSLPVALVMIYAALPVVNRVSGEAITLSGLVNGWLLPIAVGVLLLTGLAAGSYPALLLSRFRPVQVLYGRRGSTGRGGARLRRTLVVIQFAGSLALVLATLVVQEQLRYVQHKRLGFDAASVISLDREPVEAQYEAFRSTVEALPQVASVTSGIPLGIGWRYWSFSMTDRETGQAWTLDGMGVDYGFAQTMGLTIVQGRDFSRNHPSDVDDAVLLNETGARRFGIADDPIGQRITVQDEQRTVVGVVADFHYSSLHDRIGPLMIDLEPKYQWTMLVRMNPGNLSDNLAAVAGVWNTFVPDRPFDPVFLDAQIAQQYASEQRLGRIFGLFSGLAVLIACLGLFGLAAFAAAARTNEIGIRKALGAGVAGIVALLLGDFIRSVAIGLLVGVPLAWWAMHTWLGTFAYHIETPWTTFAVLAAGALALATLTVCYQVIRAATADPVRALRYE